MSELRDENASWSSVPVARAVVACACIAAPLLWTSESKAHGTIFWNILDDCPAIMNSMPVHTTIPRGRLMARVEPRTAGGASPQSCSEFTWVKVHGTAGFGASIRWGGPVIPNAWDCTHSTLSWAIYRKNANGAWFLLNGGETFGNLPEGTNTCRYNNSGEPGGTGVYSMTDPGATGPTEYRIAFYLWSHDDPGLGHNLNACSDPVSCSWAANFTFTNPRPVPIGDFTYIARDAGQPASWVTLESSTGARLSQILGVVGDHYLPGDYDGDGNSDYAVWTPGSGNWKILQSAFGGAQRSFFWGNGVGDRPAPADFDSDGKLDATYTRSVTVNGTQLKLWHVSPSRGGNAYTTYKGSWASIPVPADYDGDIRADLAVWQESTGVWSITDSLSRREWTAWWGGWGDKPVPADYDGDSRADVAVWRPSNGRWYWIPSSTNVGQEFWWGQQGDVPVPQHIDTDGKVDFVVFRPTEGRFYHRSTKTGAMSWTSFAGTGETAREFYRNE